MMNAVEKQSAAEAPAGGQKGHDKTGIHTTLAVLKYAFK